MRLFAAPLTLPRLVVCPDAERGTLLDNPSAKTLEQPDVHSLKCLVDVPMCVNGGFEILGDPEPGSGDPYTRVVRLDTSGTQQAVDLAHRTGSPSACNSCTGELGDITAGFRATVRGVLVPDSGSPPLLNTTEVLPSETGCPKTTEVPSVAPSSKMTPQPTTTVPSMAPTPTSGARSPSGSGVVCLALVVVMSAIAA